MEQLPQTLCLKGIVIHGKQLGRRIGFPTANLDIEGLQTPLPPTGVYGGICTLPDGRTFGTMVNVGYRPTVDNQSHLLSVEAHLLDFDEDLYGQCICLHITSRIRDEKKMQTLEALQQQLAQDLEVVKALR